MGSNPYPINQQENAVIEWKKSSLSSDSYNCVEVAMLADLVLVRDSKNPTGEVLGFGPEAWDAFVAGVRGGEFDRE